LAAGGVRNTVRRYIPRRVRWLARLSLRLASGHYVRAVITEFRGLSEQVADQSAAIQAQGEVLYLLLRRMRAMEDDIASVCEALDALRAELAGRTEQPGNLDVYDGLNADDDVDEPLRRPAEGSQNERAHPVTAEAYLKDETA